MKKTVYALAALVLALAAACSRNEPKLFDDKPGLWLSGDPDQRATADSVIFSFTTVGLAESWDLHLIANITGQPADHDRTFGLEVVAEKTNVGEGDYSVGELVVPAGAWKATVPVTVKRHVANPELDHDNITKRLTLRVVAGNDFQVGPAERSQYTFAWHNNLVRPASWSVIQSYLGLYTEARYRFIIEFTGYDDFEEFRGEYARLYALQATCIRLLNEYNSDPANAGRPEGWPYLNSNGNPLAFGNRVP